MPNIQSIIKEIEEGFYEKFPKGLFSTERYSRYYGNETEAVKSYLTSSLLKIREVTLQAVREKAEGIRVDIETLPSSIEIDFETLTQMKNDMKQFGNGFNTALNDIIEWSKNH